MKRVNGRILLIGGGILSLVYIINFITMISGNFTMMQGWPQTLIIINFTVLTITLLFCAFSAVVGYMIQKSG